MLIVGLFLATAFLMQGLMGFYQIKNFSKNFKKLRTKGKVLIGKNPKKFNSGTLMLISIDDLGMIKEAKIMKGVTVFAKFKNLPQLNNRYLPLLASDYEALHDLDRLTRQCLLNAYKNYIDFKTKKLSKTAYDSTVNIFYMPFFVKLKQIYMKFAEKIKKRGKNNEIYY